MFILEVVAGTSVHLYALEKEEDLEIDIISVNNENYEGIQGDYKSFSFFLNSTIREIGRQNKEKNLLLMEKQNLMISSPMIRNTNMYPKIQNMVFKDPLKSALTRKEAKTENKSIYIQAVICVFSLIVLSIYIYYQRKRVHIQR